MVSTDGSVHDVAHRDVVHVLAVSRHPLSPTPPGDTKRDVVKGAVRAGLLPVPTLVRLSQQPDHDFCFMRAKWWSGKGWMSGLKLWQPS